MSHSANELVERFEQFFRDYYRDEIGELARGFPTEQRSLYIDWEDLYRFDNDLSEDYLSHPEDCRQKAEEALRLYELPVDVKIGGAHVRLRNLPEATRLSDIRSHHISSMIMVRGTVESVTTIKSIPYNAAFECKRCGTLTRVPQNDRRGFDTQDPQECQGCERGGVQIRNEE